ncbi:hypothetical protein AAVH_06994 [Aphelenchoides avenae]|nr:hypothetical protein AAVH_06994 [Aphelenchus avenae]
MANRHSAPPAPSETAPAPTGHPSDPKPSTSSAPQAPDSSVVIANEMATNLGTKKAVRIVVRERDTKLPIALHKSSGRSRRKTHESSSYTYEPSTSEHKLEPRLPENKLANSSRTSQSTDQAAASETITDVKALKAACVLLKNTIEKENEDFNKLQEENDILRRELSEKDRIIEALQAKLKLQSAGSS